MRTIETKRAKQVLWLFVLGLTVCLAMPSAAPAAGFATSGIGIKARSMGGAFRGLANDWSAAYYNPAGLAGLKSSELNFTVGTYSPRASYTPNVTAGGLDIGFGAANGAERYPLDDLWPIPSFAGFAVSPSFENWVFGGAIYWPHDVNYAWDLFRTPSDRGYVTDYAFAEKNYRTDLDVLDIHPAVARKLNEKLSVGLGVSLTSADIVFRRPVYVENGLGAPYDIYPYHQFLGDFRLEGNGFAIGANAGILWQASENLTIGISGQTPMSVSIEGTDELDMAWPINGAFNDDFVVIDGDTINTSLYFSGIHDPLTNVKNPSHTTGMHSFDLDLPGEIGIGVGLKAGDRLTLAFDAAMTLWSAVDQWEIVLGGDGLNGGTSRLTKVTVPFNWEDQIRVSGGFEYGARDNLLLRGGAYYDAAAAPDSALNPNFPIGSDAFGLTGGFAYAIDGHIELAAAQEIAFFSEKTVEAVSEGAAVTVFPGDYKLSRFETIFSITYRF